MTAPLKPCPFCGRKPSAYKVGGYSVVYCDKPECPVTCHTAWHDTAERAAAAWNRRASSNRPGKLTPAPHTGRNRAGEKGEPK